MGYLRDCIFDRIFCLVTCANHILEKLIFFVKSLIVFVCIGSF
jgi:hypothetical protein